MTISSCLFLPPFSLSPFYLQTGCEGVLVLTLPRVCANRVWTDNTSKSALANTTCHHQTLLRAWHGSELSPSVVLIIDFDPWQASAHTPNLAITGKMQECLWFSSKLQSCITFWPLKTNSQYRFPGYFPQRQRSLNSNYIRMCLGASLSQDSICNLIQISIVKVFSRWTKYMNVFTRIDTFFSYSDISFKIKF